MAAAPLVLSSRAQAWWLLWDMFFYMKMRSTATSATTLWAFLVALGRRRSFVLSGFSEPAVFEVIGQLGVRKYILLWNLAHGRRMKRTEQSHKNVWTHKHKRWDIISLAAEGTTVPSSNYCKKFYDCHFPTALTPSTSQIALSSDMVVIP